MMDEELRTTRIALAAAVAEIDNLRAEVERLRAELSARANWQRVRSAHLVAAVGDPCPHCGDRKLVRSGSLYACDGCGKLWEEAKSC